MSACQEYVVLRHEILFGVPRNEGIEAEHLIHDGRAKCHGWRAFLRFPAGGFNPVCKTRLIENNFSLEKKKLSSKESSRKIKRRFACGPPFHGICIVL